jgi:CubicO group peptidase (beta-lactamase class C family)
VLALIRMDWTLHRRTWARISPLVLLWLAAAASGPGQLLGTTATLALLFVVMPLFPYLRPDSIETFLWALPVSRTQIVVARYLASLIGLAAGLALPLALGCLCHAVGSAEFRHTPLADIAAGTTLVGLVWCAALFLFLPFQFRFGGERGMGYFLASALLAGIALILRFGWDFAGLVQRFLTLGDTLLEGKAILRLVLATLALGLASLGVSIHVYRRRASERPPAARPRILAALALLVVLAGFGATFWAPETHALDAMLAPCFKADAPGAAVLVVREGRTVLRRGYGTADPGRPFRIGSLTKQFTAALVLQMVDEGRLRLDAPIRAYLPEVPATWGKVTLAQCLHHTAGLPDYLATKEFRRGAAGPATPAQLLALVSDLPLESAPGDRFRYSNTGYLLLGMALERVAGRTYGDLLQERICKPLGLAGTRMGGSELQGFTLGGRPTGPFHESQAFAAGGMVATVDDLATWSLALAGGRVLKPAGLAFLTTPGHTNDGRSTGYGGGLAILERSGETLYRHEGLIPGFASVLVVDPREKAVVVLLFNTDAPPAVPFDRLVNRAFGIPTPTHHPIALAPEDLDRFTGSYASQSSREGILRIRREGARLEGRMEGQPAFRLVPEAPTRFYLEAVEATLSFEVGADGRTVGLTLDQDGLTFPFRRVAD